MNPIEDKQEAVTLRAVSRDEEGRKKVKKTEVISPKIDTFEYVEKKLMDNGFICMEHHPTDGIDIRQAPPKSGHGGKYTWEGPDDLVESELEPAPPAIDEKDPNYVNETAEERILKEEEPDVGELVVGEVEVPKVLETKMGVAKVEIDPHLKLN